MSVLLFTPSDLPRLRADLEAAKRLRDTDTRMAGGIGSYGIPMLQTVIDVCELGWSCQWVSQGLRVDTEPPVILATQKDKYRIVGTNRWEPYYHIEHVVPRRPNTQTEQERP